MFERQSVWVTEYYTQNEVYSWGARLKIAANGNTLRLGTQRGFNTFMVGLFLGDATLGLRHVLPRLEELSLDPPDLAFRDSLRHDNDDNTWAVYKHLLSTAKYVKLFLEWISLSKHLAGMKASEATGRRDIHLTRIYRVEKACPAEVINEKKAPRKKSGCRKTPEKSWPNLVEKLNQSPHAMVQSPVAFPSCLPCQHCLCLLFASNPVVRCTHDRRQD